MLKKPVISDKIFVLGLDGLDPRLLNHYLSQGKMPNFKKFVDAGCQREDLVMLGANPTVTPAQWTTLATGAYPCTHGVSDYYRQLQSANLDEFEYNFDSRKTKAELVWNALAEAGMKTLVFHWPGSAWPPTSDNPNLHVVDGTTPGSPCYGAATVETEFFLGANESVKELRLIPKATDNATAPCVTEGLTFENNEEHAGVEFDAGAALAPVTINYIMTDDEGMRGFVGGKLDVIQSPIKPATGWKYAPADAKEFSLLLAKGKIRRPGLILKGENGKYDHIALYKNKKEEAPIFEAYVGKLVPNIIDQGLKGEEQYCNVIRNFKLLSLDEDGTALSMYISGAMDIDNDSVWHPRSLYKSVTDNVGYPPPTSNIGSQDRVQLVDCMHDNWNVNIEWQANALNYLMDNGGYNVVFSHYHGIDLQMHLMVRFMSDKKQGNWTNKIPPEEYQQMMENVYEQADRYVSKFLHYLDEGWTIFIVSDHALVCPAHVPPMLGDMTGVNVNIMEELGYTVMKIDENGNKLRECDWSKTRAVAGRACHININLKGRNPHGIVDPADQYELEEQIMTDLYGVKDPITGKRVVALALRNRDAYLLGLGGPESGDIVYFTAEGYNYDHTDGLSTCWGDAYTSLSPAFIACGKGIKKGEKTNRIIRQVDLAPTISLLTGTRMAAQCEGAPIYQILEEY